MADEGVDLLAGTEGKNLIGGPDDERGTWDKVKGWARAPAETIASVASGMARSSVSGLYGIAALTWGGVGAFRPPLDHIVREMGEIQNKAYSPESPEGQAVLNVVNYPLEKWSEHVAKKGGEFSQDLGAPAWLATGIEVGLEFAPWILLPAAYRKGKGKSASEGFRKIQEETFDTRLVRDNPQMNTAKLSEARAEWTAIAETKTPTGVAAVKAKANEVATAVHETVSPIGTGSPKAQATAKNYANQMRLADGMRNHQIRELNTRFKKKDFENMYNAASLDELALAEGRTPAAINSLPLDQANAVRALQEVHKVIEAQAINEGIISVGKEGYLRALCHS